MDTGRPLRLKIVENVAAAAVECFLTAGREAIATNDTFLVALSGGNTPRELYRRLQPNDLPWDAVDLFFGDERAVPQDHEHSNFRMVHESLLCRIPAARAHFLHDAAEYEELLTARLGPSGRFDCLLLGLGEDGHTASLFPGSPALREDRRWVVATKGPPPCEDRLTLTPPVILAARRILMLVSGEKKAQILADVLEGPANRYPGGIVLASDGPVEWLVDRAAASQLSRVESSDPPRSGEVGDPQRKR